MSNKVLQFLEHYNIPYITSGKNCKKGNYNIHCPFCSQDEGFHMGIIPGNGFYGCWRDTRHRGRNFARVIREILRCSWEEANRLAGEETTLEEGDDLEKMVDSLFEEDSEEERELGGAKSLQLPDSFKEISSRDSTAQYLRYMEGRGFTDLKFLFRKYEVVCCQVGEWKKRIIFPLYHNDKLVSWQGRSIYNDSTLPYKDLSVEESVRHVKYCLYNYDTLLLGGKILMVCEGLMDFLKLDFYSPRGFKATCFFTKTMTDEQMYLLLHLATLYEEVWFVLDRDAEVQASDLVAELQVVRKNIRTVELPEGIDDPGDIPVNDVSRFCLQNKVK